MRQTPLEILARCAIFLTADAPCFSCPSPAQRSRSSTFADRRVRYLTLAHIAVGGVGHTPVIEDQMVCVSKANVPCFAEGDQHTQAIRERRFMPVCNVCCTHRLQRHSSFS